MCRSHSVMRASRTVSMWKSVCTRACGWQVGVCLWFVLVRLSTFVVCSCVCVLVALVFVCLCACVWPLFVFVCVFVSCLCDRPCAGVRVCTGVLGFVCPSVWPCLGGFSSDTACLKALYALVVCAIYTYRCTYTYTHTVTYIYRYRYIDIDIDVYMYMYTAIAIGACSMTHTYRCIRVCPCVCMQ